MNKRLKDGFGQCSSNVMRDPSINIRDKAVYSFLCTYADSQTNELFISVHKTSSHLNISYSTTIRAFQSLEKKGIIKRIKKGKGQTSVTIILK